MFFFVCLLVLFCFVLFLSKVSGTRDDSISNIYQTSKPVMYMVYVVTLVSWHGHRRARKKKTEKNFWNLFSHCECDETEYLHFSFSKPKILVCDFFLKYVCVASLLCSLFCFQPSPFTSEFTKCFHTLYYGFGEGGGREGGIILFVVVQNELNSLYSLSTLTVLVLFYLLLDFKRIGGGDLWLMCFFKMFSVQIPVPTAMHILVRSH